jgi:DNA (cytosine-5)-methyltransferase 1
MKRDAISLSLDLGSELIIDNFAGGGGASEGMEQAFGRPVDIAINHNSEALAMHAANHPGTKHYCEDVFQIDPIEATKNQPVGLVWLSPDCRHHSKAKGGKPVEKKIRGLAWIGRKWAGKSKPRALMLENVEEIQSWTGLVAKRDKATGRVFKLDGSVAEPGERVPVQEQHLVANPKTKGSHFRRFVRSLEDMGYRVEHRELRACDFGAPTIRKRLYLIARRDHLPIVWPTQTHGDPKSPAVKAGKLKPWRTAAECIDWSIPCPSIFERERPLKDATLSRIAKGIMKFVVNSADPFIVRTAHGEVSPTGVRRWGVGEHDGADPLPTVTASSDFAAVAPTLMHVTHQGSDRNAGVDSPIATVTGANRGEQALVSATLIQTGYGERPGQAPRVPGLDKPLGTAVAGGVKHALVTAFLAQHNKERVGVKAGRPVEVPISTVTASGGQQQVVSAFLAKHYGGHESPGSALGDSISTITTQDHHHLVTAHIQRDFGQSVGGSADDPMGTVTAGGGGHQALVTGNILKLRGTNTGHAFDEPLHTVSAQGTHHAEVRAFLIKYYGNDKDGANLRSPLGTIPTHDRFGLVTVHGEDYIIVDIGMRMLTPRELATAQGFPSTYILDPIVNGKPLSKSAQVRMIGNSVCPDVATALILANFAHEKQMAGAAA